VNNKLLIIGASGHGKVIAEIALQMNRYKNIVFLDDDINIKTTMGIAVVGRISDAIKYVNECDIIVGIGNNEIREKVQKYVEVIGARIPILAHPSAIISKNVKIGAGTVIMAGAVVNCCSEIGRGCIINTGATIDHESVIGNYVHLSPGVHLAGAVSVGHNTWLGIGSIVKNNIGITEGCIVGAGSVVIKSITEPGTYVGVPARKI